MDKSERQSHEETYLWIPFQFLDQIIKAIFKCLGLPHRDSPTTTKTATSAMTLNQPEEEEEDVFMEEVVLISTKGIKNDIVVSARATKVKGKMVKNTRATKVKGKIVKKEKHSSGRSGGHN